MPSCESSLIRFGLRYETVAMFIPAMLDPGKAGRWKAVGFGKALNSKIVILKHLDSCLFATILWLTLDKS